MKPSSAKQKGRLLQQWVRNKLIAFGKGLTLDDVRSTGMGQSGEDIQLSTAAKKQFPLAIECKSLARHAAYKHYAQAVEHAEEKLYPVVIIKQNQCAPLAIMDADLALQLIEYFWRNDENSSDPRHAS